MDFIQYYYFIIFLSFIITIYYVKNIIFEKVDKIFIYLLKPNVNYDDNESKDYKYFIRMIDYMSVNELNDLRDILQIQVNTKKNYYTNKKFTELEIDNMIKDIKYINKINVRKN